VKGSGIAKTEGADPFGPAPVLVLPFVFLVFFVAFDFVAFVLFVTFVF
jgi:hypothetical protein